MNKNKTFNDSYSLIKILSRWFGIIEFNKLIEELISDGYVIREMHDKIGKYFYTEKAQKKFISEINEFEKQIKSTFPDKVDVINTLFSNI